MAQRRRSRAEVESYHQDRVFMNLIRQYTKFRDWKMLEYILYIYGRILEDRIYFCYNDKACTTGPCVKCNPTPTPNRSTP